MPRPSSKVMSDTSSPDVSDVPVSNVKPLRAVPVKKTKAAAPEAPKVNVKEQKAALKTALAKAREPLTDREGKLKVAEKALTDHDRVVEAMTKERVKQVAAADKVFAKAVAEKDKARKALLKAKEAAEFSVGKAKEQFAKGEAKINERIDALTPPPKD